MAIFGVTKSFKGEYTVRTLLPGMHSSPKELGRTGCPDFAFVDEGVLEPIHGYATMMGFPTSHDVGLLGPTVPYYFRSGKLCDCEDSFGSLIVNVGVPFGSYNLVGHQTVARRVVERRRLFPPAVDQQGYIYRYTETRWHPNIVLKNGKPIFKSDWVGLLRFTSASLCHVWYSEKSGVVLFGINRGPESVSTKSGLGITYYLVDSCRFFVFLYPTACGNDLILAEGDPIIFPRPIRQYKPAPRESFCDFFGLPSRKLRDLQNTKNVQIIGPKIGRTVGYAATNDVVVFRHDAWVKLASNYLPTHKGNVFREDRLGSCLPVVVAKQQVIPFEDSMLKCVAFIMPHGDCVVQFPINVDVVHGQQNSRDFFVRVVVKNTRRKGVTNYFNNVIALSVLVSEGYYVVKHIGSNAARWFSIMANAHSGLGVDFPTLMGNYYGVAFNPALYPLRLLKYVGYEVPYGFDQGKLVHGKRALYRSENSGKDQPDLILFEPFDNYIFSTDFRFVSSGFDLIDMRKRGKCVDKKYMPSRYLLVENLSDWLCDDEQYAAVYLTNRRPEGFQDFNISIAGWMEAYHMDPENFDQEFVTDTFRGSYDFECMSDCDHDAIQRVVLSCGYAHTYSWDVTKVEDRTIANALNPHGDDFEDEDKETENEIMNDL